MPATKQVLVRTAVADLYARGAEPTAIARSVGIPVDRVEEILDFLDSHPGYDQPAAVIAAVPEPAHTIQPGPEPTRSSPEPVRPSPEPVKPALRPAARLAAAIEEVGEAMASGDTASAISPKPGTREHASRRGYQQHYAHKEKPCQSCKDAWNESERTRRAAKKTGGGSAEMPSEKPRVKVRWLVPRGERLPPATHVEFEIRHHGAPITHTTRPEIAEQAASTGARVLRRLVTNWTEVTAS